LPTNLLTRGRTWIVLINLYILRKLSNSIAVCT